MKFPILVFLFSACLMAQAAKAPAEPPVKVGDTLAVVAQKMGIPKIEFPLNGQLVQDYGDWVILSRNQIVVSIRQRKDDLMTVAGGPDEPVTNAAPTWEVLTARAEAGEAEAQYSLGYCYHSGTPVEKDMAAAIHWYTLAAMQDHMAAQNNLGIIFMKGQGLEKDLETAYTWGLLAADNGNDALARAVRPQLTSDQEASARARADALREEIALAKISASLTSAAPTESVDEMKNAVDELLESVTTGNKDPESTEDD